MAVVRDNKYLARVRGHACLVCLRPPRSHAHHMKMVEAMGQGLKVGDQWTVPLCFNCHNRLHGFGDEQTFWDLQGVDPIRWAKSNWKEYERDD